MINVQLICRTILSLLLWSVSSPSLSAYSPVPSPVQSIHTLGDTTRDTIFTCDLMSVGSRVDTLNNGSGQESILITTTLLHPSSYTQIGSAIRPRSNGNSAGGIVSMSADGRCVAVGVDAATNNDGVSTGQAHVYEWSGGTWVQLGENLYGDQQSESFGSAVSLSADGSVLAVASPRRNIDNLSNVGQVQVYRWNNNLWTPLGGAIPGKDVEDRFGRSISLSADGDRLAIGAYKHDGFDIDVGQVIVYEWDGSTWTQLGSALDGVSRLSLFGFSLSLSDAGDRLAVGASKYGISTGHVIAFEWDGTDWTQLGEDIKGEADLDQFGTSVALSGDGMRLAAGSDGNDGNGNFAGHVRVFEWKDSSWVQMGSDLDGEAAGDKFGISTALSADGSFLVAGATFNDASGAGDRVGHVRIYSWNGFEWSQVGEDLDGKSASSEAGASVAISDDGSRIVFSEPRIWGGQARVFEFDCLNVSVVETHNKPVFLAAPNPSDGDIRFLLDLPMLTQISLSLYDVQGRLVRQWHPGLLSGHHKLLWDGQDQQGHLLPAGLYVARMSSPEGAQILKVIKR